MYARIAFGFVFKHLPRDPANVNTLKTMVDPYSGLSILLHGVILLPDARRHMIKYIARRLGLHYDHYVSPSTQ